MIEKTSELLRIRELDRIGEKPQVEERHAVSKINRAISMKIAIKDRKKCNIPAVRKSVMQREAVCPCLEEDN
ncbi:hypothetical protein E2C01_056335 [Portunus trituberculatus]|uniref:Uncharacterized protein n=1 Tax=Portunus trituberculatus TaxID=210409 RepID=A0A5B7GTU4_PORTR|nr:hypothetical protein [Portunus trituberculatus]